MFSYYSPLPVYDVVQFWRGRVENTALPSRMEPSDTDNLGAVRGALDMIGDVEEISCWSFRFGIWGFSAIDGSAGQVSELDGETRK